MTSAPSTDAHDSGIHSLTLILSVQRSGSTLLGRDIESLGGLGSPREHFRGGIDAQAGRPPSSEREVLERLRLGVQDGAPGISAVKLQVSQATRVAAAVTGKRQPTTVQAASTVVSWARENFDRVLFVVLVRNAVDTAISKVFAKETGTYLSSKRRSHEPETALPELEDLNRRILDEFQSALRQRAILHEVAREHADIALLLTYDQLVREQEATTRRLVAHAHAQGFEPHGETVTRTLEKVISQEQAAEVRASFFDFLATETGI